MGQGGAGQGGVGQRGVGQGRAGQEGAEQGEVGQGGSFSSGLWIWMGCALWSHLRCVFIPCAPEETGNLPGRVMVPETATVDRSPCLRALRKILLPSHLTRSTDLGRMNTSNGAAKRNCCRAGV